MTLELFPTAPTAPPGFTYAPDLVALDEELALLANLSTLALAEVRMHGVVARRTTAHFGWDYGYSSWRITPAPPMPAFLDELRRRAAALAHLDPATLEEVLVTRYQPGAGIGWHRDAPMFGPSVIGVSLGAPCVLRFRRRRTHDGACRVTLAPRSAYVLDGEARSEWQHMIAAVKAERWSVTFRTVVRRPT